MPTVTLGEGDGFSVVLGADFGHEFFGEVAAFVGDPLVVGVGQDGAAEADDSGLVGDCSTGGPGRCCSTRSSAGCTSGSVAAPSNFARHLTEPDSELAQELTKDR